MMPTFVGHEMRKPLKLRGFPVSGLRQTKTLRVGSFVDPPRACPPIHKWWMKMTRTPKGDESSQHLEWEDRMVVRKVAPPAGPAGGHFSNPHPVFPH